MAVFVSSTPFRAVSSTHFPRGGNSKSGRVEDVEDKNAKKGPWQKKNFFDSV